MMHARIKQCFWGTLLDARPLAAWGFHARNVQSLSLENVRLTRAKDNLRPVLIADDVERLTVDGFRFPEPAGAAEAPALRSIGRATLRSGCQPEHAGATGTPQGLDATSPPW